MISKVLRIMQSTVARASFLILALAFGAWAVISQWDSIIAALSMIDPWILPVALLCSVLYVAATFFAWRDLLDAQRPGLELRQLARVFFVSQLGKYLPGGIWNIVAAAELGKDHQISRVHSVVVMLQSTVVSIATGLLVGILGVLAGPSRVWASTWWVLFVLPVVLIALAPPVVNRLTTFTMRVLKRGPLEMRATWSSIGLATAWSVVSWVFSGAQVWLLGVGLGLEASLQSFLLCVQAYALAWTVGFIVKIAPAGIGVREGVLGLLLANVLTSGGVIALVLLARVVVTVADVLLGAIFLPKGARRERAVEDHIA